MGKRYSHIIDPRTGLGLTERRGVTVIAPTGMQADGLASAVSVLGWNDGQKVITQEANCFARVVALKGGEWKEQKSCRFPKLSDR